MTFDPVLTPPPGWKAETLGELCERGAGSVQTGPFGSQLHAEDYRPTGTPVVMPQDIRDGRVVVDAIARISREDVDRLSRHQLQRGNIVYSRRGDISRRALIREEQTGWLCGTGCLKIDVRDAADPRFLFFYLSHPAVHGWLERHAVGATMPNLNTKILESLPVTLPSLDEQRRIAWALGSLDDKIEHNRRIAETLEQIATAIFKARFIDFVGVEEFDDSELGRIPKGWQVVSVGDAVKTVGGGTPSTKDPTFWDGGSHAWATPKDLSDHQSPILLDTSRHLTEVGIAKISSGLLPPETVLLSSRAPIGYTAISKVPIAVNQGFIAFPPTGHVAPEYILFWVRHNLDRIKSSAGGTTFAEISKRAFGPIPMLVPPEREMEDFRAIARPAMDAIARLDSEAVTLRSTRDTLLPKLSSGDIRVPEGFGPESDPSDLIDTDTLASGEDRTASSTTAAA